MVESGRLPKTGKIRASTGEGSGRVPEKVPGKYRERVQASTGEGFGQVPKMAEFGQVPKKGPGEYGRRGSNSGAILRNHQTKRSRDAKTKALEA